MKMSFGNTVGLETFANADASLFVVCQSFEVNHVLFDASRISALLK